MQQDNQHDHMMVWAIPHSFCVVFTQLHLVVTVHSYYQLQAAEVATIWLLIT